MTDPKQPVGSTKQPGLSPSAVPRKGLRIICEAHGEMFGWCSECLLLEESHNWKPTPFPSEGSPASAAPSRESPARQSLDLPQAYTRNQVLAQLGKDWAEGDCDVDVLLEQAYNAGAGLISEGLADAISATIRELEDLDD
jgi:hypothetical protein